MTMTAVAIANDMRIADFILRGVRLGEGSCLLSGSTEVGRAEFINAVEEMAQSLKDAGLQPGDIVGVRLSRGLGLVTALLGVMRAGGVYLPLDPQYPEERLEFMRKDSSAAFEISETGIQRIPTQPKTEDTRHLAYLIYTSGSTGRPKGVAVTQANVINFLSSMIHRPGITADDKWLAVTTASFDISVLELFGPLAAGAQVIVASDTDTRDGEALARLLTVHQVTHMQATPSTWRMLLDTGWSGNQGLRALCGGEPLSSSLATSLLPKVRELWNMYGPTETTVWSCCGQVTDPAHITLGTQITNTDIFLLNEQGHETKLGKGEICIGGAGVVDGYWRRPDLTREKFPIINGHRVFATGDLGEFTEHDELLFRGRVDRQIKLRGHRIEPEEIERILMSLQGINDAAVTIDMLDGVPNRLIAHVAPPVDIRQLSDQLSDLLPTPMLPANYRLHESLPRLPNGKIDRHALANIIVEARETTSPSSMTPTEEKIATVFSQLLEKTVEHPQMNFFELGGHSLLAARALGILKKDVHSAITLKDIFDAESITALAHKIDRFDKEERFEF